jgi:YD repeat-containing protein
MMSVPIDHHVAVRNLGGSSMSLIQRQALPVSGEAAEGTVISRLAARARSAVRLLGQGLALVALLAVLPGAMPQAYAYDVVVPTNWSSAGVQLTPSRCNGVIRDSYWTMPSGTGAPSFPESARGAALAFANANCSGKNNGTGACSTITGWSSAGDCRLDGNGLQNGLAWCPIRVTVVNQRPFGNDGCEGEPQTSEAERLVGTYKYCTANADAHFDATRRECVCNKGVYVPEQQRCVGPDDVYWIPKCDTCKGNPIYPTVGAKIQRFTLGWQPWYGLRATYNSIRRIPYDPSLGTVTAPTDPTTIGPAWTTNLDKQVGRSDGRPRNLTFARGDGDTTQFRWAGSGYVSQSAGGTDTVLERGWSMGWIYRSPKDGTLEVYSSTDGSLESMSDLTGKRLTIKRSDASTPTTVAPRAGLPIELTDQDGRVVKLRYAAAASDAAPSLSQVIDPANAVTEIQYAAPGRPSKIVNTDTTFTQLIYEDPRSPWALTGYLNENGVRAGTYAYDAEGRAISTMRAGGLDSYSVTWAQPSHWSWYETYDSFSDKVLRVHILQPASGIVVTNPNGQVEAISAVSTMSAVQWASKSQQAGAGSAEATTNRQFDERGNVTRLDDYNGNRSCMSYESGRNLEVSRVEGLSKATDCASVATGSLPAGARKVSTQWHPVWQLATRTAEPGRITTLVYNGQPDPFNGNAVANCEASGARLPDDSVIVVLCKRVEQATTDLTGEQGFSATPQAGLAARTTSWTYTPTGQVLTEKDSRGVTIVTNEYYADTTTDHTKGDLKSSTNALGHKTSFTRYNAYGQPLEMLDVNSISTVYAYDARQRLSVVTSGGVATSYDYWPTGLLKKTSQPDGSAVNYEYDDAGRLKAVFDSQGNRVEYTLDASGNRTQEVAKDPSGTLKRTMSRVFDALGRAQQTTGRE